MAKRYKDVYHDADTNKLYGSLDSAINYLQKVRKEHPDWQLHEFWSGYEDMTMTFYESRLETDDEYESRLKQEAHQERLAKQEQDRKAALEKDRKEYEKLRRKLGYMR